MNIYLIEYLIKKYSFLKENRYYKFKNFNWRVENHF